MGEFKAVKPFGFYPDGFTRHQVEVGDTRDFGDAAEGLMKEGFLEAVEAVKEVADEAANEAAKFPANDAENAEKPADTVTEEAATTEPDPQPVKRRRRPAKKDA